MSSVSPSRVRKAVSTVRTPWRSEVNAVNAKRPAVHSSPPVHALLWRSKRTPAATAPATSTGRKVTLERFWTTAVTATPYESPVHAITGRVSGTRGSLATGTGSPSGRPSGSNRSIITSGSSSRRSVQTTA